MSTRKATSKAPLDDTFLNSNGIRPSYSPRPAGISTDMESVADDSAAVETTATMRSPLFSYKNVFWPLAPVALAVQPFNQNRGTGLPDVQEESDMSTIATEMSPMSRGCPSELGDETAGGDSEVHQSSVASFPLLKAMETDMQVHENLSPRLDVTNFGHDGAERGFRASWMGSDRGSILKEKAEFRNLPITKSSRSGITMASKDQSGLYLPSRFDWQDVSIESRDTANSPFSDFSEGRDDSPSMRNESEGDKRGESIEIASGQEAISAMAVERLSPSKQKKSLSRVFNFKKKEKQIAKNKQDAGRNGSLSVALARVATGSSSGILNSSDSSRSSSRAVLKPTLEGLDVSAYDGGANTDSKRSPKRRNLRIAAIGFERKRTGKTRSPQNSEMDLHSKAAERVVSASTRNPARSNLDELGKLAHPLQKTKIDENTFEGTFDSVVVGDGLSSNESKRSIDGRLEEEESAVSNQSNEPLGGGALIFPETVGMASQEVFLSDQQQSKRVVHVTQDDGSLLSVNTLSVDLTDPEAEERSQKSNGPVDALGQTPLDTARARSQATLNTTDQETLDIGDSGRSLITAGTPSTNKGIGLLSTIKEEAETESETKVPTKIDSPKKRILGWRKSFKKVKDRKGPSSDTEGETKDSTKAKRFAWNRKVKSSAGTYQSERNRVTAMDKEQKTGPRPPLGRPEIADSEKEQTATTPKTTKSDQGTATSEVDVPKTVQKRVGFADVQLSPMPEPQSVSHSPSAGRMVSSVDYSRNTLAIGKNSRDRDSSGSDTRGGMTSGQVGKPLGSIPSRDTMTTVDSDVSKGSKGSHDSSKGGHTESTPLMSGAASASAAAYGLATITEDDEESSRFSHESRSLHSDVLSAATKSSYASNTTGSTDFVSGSYSVHSRRRESEYSVDGTQYSLRSLTQDSEYSAEATRSAVSVGTFDDSRVLHEDRRSFGSETATTATAYRSLDEDDAGSSYLDSIAEYFGYGAQQHSEDLVSVWSQSSWSRQHGIEVPPPMEKETLQMKSRVGSEVTTNSGFDVASDDESAAISTLGDESIIAIRDAARTIRLHAQKTGTTPRELVALMAVNSCDTEQTRNSLADIAPTFDSESPPTGFFDGVTKYLQSL